MKNEFSYIPSESKLVELVENESDKKDKESQRIAIETVAQNLYLNNHYIEDINSKKAIFDAHVVRLIVFDRLGFPLNNIGTLNINTTYAVMTNNQFLKLINLVNEQFIESNIQAFLKKLIKGSRFVKLELNNNEEKSNIYTLDNNYKILTKDTLSTVSMKHFINIYNEEL
ncbi:hypothetical protein [Staphylococcus cohnii]|uniref:hypothetical protein n=1 Tax=Staphylococcus cohnii TaxID=29382 RepID=UPI003D7DE457